MRDRATLWTVRAALSVSLLACGCQRPDREVPDASRTRPLERAATLSTGERLDPPAVEGAFAPRWGFDRGEPFLSWLEPVREGPPEGGHREAHSFRFARFSTGAWQPASTVAEGEDLFANWADTPTIVETGSGALRAHWLQKTGDATYSYSIALARSEDGGRSWRREGFLNEDETMTEHGFVSTATASDGTVTAVWLDGREMVDGGTMTLRAARDGEPSVVIDERVCECCATDVADSARGLIVAYRDRSSDEVRDISIVRSRVEGWTEPTTLHQDGWRIEGCPVNGPAITADGAAVAVAWFTAADDRPRVSVALSSDGGVTFSRPLLLDDADPIGRVDACWSGDRAAVTWLGRSAEHAVVYLQGVARDGTIGPRMEIARTEASRRSGVPVLAGDRANVYVAWTEAAPGAPVRLRARVIAHETLR